jgi:hypothetical protein
MTPLEARKHPLFPPIRPFRLLLFCIFINSRHHTQREKRTLSPQTQEKCQKPLVQRNIMLLEVVKRYFGKIFQSSRFENRFPISINNIGP